MVGAWERILGWAKRHGTEEGAWADMLVVDGDPVRDIDVLKDFESNFVVITGDHPVHGNTLA
jgi:imidazolonepropionase-like amidohydrolase